MWKELNLKEFLMQYGQDLDPQKKIARSKSALNQISKLKNDSSKKQSLQKTTKNVENKIGEDYKICEFCSIRVSKKKYIKHTKLKCSKNINELDIIEKNSEKRKQNNLRLIYSPKIQLLHLAKELKQPVEIIVKELKNREIEITSKRFSIDKTIADEIRLKFRILKQKSISSNKYKKCPLCSTSIKTEEYDLHFKEKCPTHISKETKHQKVEKQTRKLEVKECPYCLISVSLDSFKKHLNEECPNNPKKIDVINSILSIERLSWTLLPQGEWLFSEITNHFRRLSKIKKWQNKTFDENRLQKIEKLLKPNRCYVGNNEFEGYVVYCFAWTNNIILECPIYQYLRQIRQRN